MTSQDKRWVIPNKLPPEAETALHGYPPVLRQILYNRGYSTAESARSFLETKPSSGTEPTKLLSMRDGVDRVRFALRQNEQITVYGDYDADGVCATALLVLGLAKLGANVHGYIPNRFDDGYGLNTDAINKLHADGTELIITVDCGIRSLAEAEFARQLGMGLIITDHHRPGDELPQADAIINPKQVGDDYPEKNLAGVGVAYKLLSALLDSDDATDFLDLVAIGTVADLVPLTGENRWLVSEGIKRIRQPQRQGLQALIGVSGLHAHEIQASHIGFSLGPRLNAAGRLETALDAYDLLLTPDIARAATLAQQLEIQNRKRQQITREIQENAEERFSEKQLEDSCLLFVADPDYNPGVVGLVASRLTEKYYRPSIVGHVEDDFTRASCRSIPEFHITDALDECADILVRHGGHAAAAGFTVKNENLPELISRLSTTAAQKLAGEDLQPTLTADLELPLFELSSEMIEYLEWLEPTGYANPRVQFASRNVKVVNSRQVGRDRAHLKLLVSDGKVVYDAIAFRQGDWHQKLPGNIDLLYIFEENEYLGEKRLQLNVQDIKATH